MPPYNDFLANVQGGLSLMAPLIAAKHREEDRAESNRRFDTSLGQRQLESDREFGIAQERQKSLSSYHDTLRLESEVRRRAQERQLEQARLEIEQSAEHQKRLDEIEKRLADASRQPGGKHYASAVTDAIYNNPDLLSSQNPAVKARMQALNKTVEARMAVGMATERMKEEAEAAQLGMDLPSYQRFKRRKELASIGGNPADADSLPDGPEGEVAMAAKRYAIESAAKQKPSKVTVRTSRDKDGNPTESIERELDASSPEAQRFLTPQPAAPKLSSEQQSRLESLQGLLTQLRAEAKADPEAVVDTEELAGNSPSMDKQWMFGGVKIGDAIKEVEAAIGELSGASPLRISDSKPAPPPAEDGQVHQPKGAEDMSRIPSGARYINPADGKIYIKK